MEHCYTCIAYEQPIDNYYKPWYYNSYDVNMAIRISYTLPMFAKVECPDQ